MARRLEVLLVVFAIVVAASGQLGEDSGTWTYGGHSEWPNRFPNCTGTSQSPIDISSELVEVNSLLHRLRLNDACAVFPGDQINVTNTGTLISARFAPPVVFEAMRCHIVDGMTGSVYTLDRIDFHRTSEHRIDGEPREVEAQLVFRNAAIASAPTLIVAATFTNVDTHPGAPLAELLLSSPLPNVAGASVTVEVTAGDFETARARVGVADVEHRQSLMVLGELMPAADESYFFYEGSLTAPPCTENVRWFVMSEPLFLSRGTTLELHRALANVVEGFADAGGNVRPVQPLGTRRVHGFKSAALDPTPSVGDSTLAPNGVVPSAPTPSNEAIPEPPVENKKKSVAAIIGITLVSCCFAGLLGYGVYLYVQKRDIKNFEDMLKNATTDVKKVGKKVSRRAEEQVSYDDAGKREMSTK